MSTTTFLAQIIGVFSLIMGFSMLFERKMVMSVFSDIFKKRAFSYIIGVAELIIGLIIVLLHNFWGGFLQALISLLGWAMVLEGSIYLFLSEAETKKILGILEEKHIYYLLSVGYLLLGGYLAYKGFVI